MIAIIDYKMGNLRSVENALKRLGQDYTVTADPKVILAADKVLLPGVGNAAEAMANLNAACLTDTIRSIRKPVLGICVGLQVMCRDSEEGMACGLGIFDCHVRKFIASEDAKVPHMGWNSISNMDSKLFRDIPKGQYVYYVHSFYPELCPDTIATSVHGGKMFSAALKYENFYGTQFHPEKSGDIGEAILRNFVKL